MAIAYISSQFVLDGNTVTIPVGTTMAVGLCHRVGATGLSTPTLTGAAMTVGAVSSDYVGIYYVDSPVAGTYTLGGFDTYFVYFSGTNSVRAGALSGTTNTDPFLTSINSSYDDFVICNAFRYSGTSSANITWIKIDGVAITYIQNYYEGYRQASGESAAIDVSWSSAGYTLYYTFLSIQSLVASDQSTFMSFII